MNSIFSHYEKHIYSGQYYIIGYKRGSGWELWV